MSIEATTFETVRDLVRAESAIVLGPGKEYLVETRLLPLSRQGGHASVDALVQTMVRSNDAGVRRRVVEALTTNETSWFRDVEPFNTLRDVALPELARTRAGRRLRIWSAACSSGQEPYSLAIVAGDVPQLAGWQVEVLATDLSEEVLEAARRGEYSQMEVNRGLPASALVRHFTRSGTNWRINPELGRQISFRQLNLMRPFGQIGQFDVVFLRNVLIYFDLATKRDILQRVRQVLAPDGYLFLGAAEMTMGVDPGWERLPLGQSSVYRPVAGTTRGIGAVGVGNLTRA